jgi:hypothetical protein
MRWADRFEMVVSKRPARRAAASIADGSLVVASVTTPSWVVTAPSRARRKSFSPPDAEPARRPMVSFELLHDDEGGREVVELAQRTR